MMFHFSLETKEVKFLNLCLRLLSIVSCKIRERKKVKFLNLCIKLLKEAEGLPIVNVIIGKM